MHSSSKKPLLLVVEDEPGIAGLLTDVLENAGYAVQVADTALCVLACFTSPATGDMQRILDLLASASVGLRGAVRGGRSPRARA